MSGAASEGKTENKITFRVEFILTLFFSEKVAEGNPSETEIRININNRSKVIFLKEEI